MMNKTLAFTFGRFSPPTIGHEKLVNAVKKHSGDTRVYLSHTVDKKKNPLKYADKLRFARKAFGNIVFESPQKTIIGILQDAEKSYNKIIMVVGSDRVEEFKTLLNKYNGKEYKFDEIQVVSAGERDPDASDVSGMSASKMREAATAGDFSSFKQGLPKKLQTTAKEVFDMVREGMGITEEVEELEEAGKQPLTIAQRRKRAMNMRRIRTKLKTAKKRLQRRKASEDKLKQRAKRKARMALKKRFSANKSYSSMSASEKIAVDRRVAKVSDATLQRLARKALPQVRRAEMDRLAAMGKKKNESIEEDFNAFLTEQRFLEYLDEARTSVDGTPAKKFHNLLNKNGTVKLDGRFKMFKKQPIQLPNGNTPATAKIDENMSLADFAVVMEAFMSELEEDKPTDRLDGTDSLVKKYKKDTPGENDATDNE